MSNYPPIWCLLTTYRRTSIAIKTIQGIKTNLIYPNIGFVVCDDGSGGNHLSDLVNEIGPSYAIHTYDGNRRGVGHNMNWGLNKIWELGGNLCLMLEDDWFLKNPTNFLPYVELLENSPDIGMIRMGYLSAGLESELISRNNKLWLKFKQN